MPDRIEQDISFTQGDDYTIQFPMEDMSLPSIGTHPDGSLKYPDLDMTGRTYEARIAPGWIAEASWPFAVSLIGSTIICVLTDDQTAEMPLDCFWDLSETIGGATFTFIGGKAHVKRKVPG